LLDAAAAPVGGLIAKPQEKLNLAFLDFNAEGKGRS